MTKPLLVALSVVMAGVALVAWMQGLEGAAHDMLGAATANAADALARRVASEG